MSRSPSCPHGCGHPTPTARSDLGSLGSQARATLDPQRIPKPRLASMIDARSNYGIEAGGDGFEEVRELGFFAFGEFGEDKVDVADLFSQSVVPCPEAKPWEVFSA